ncbi:hypothetical protein [Nocardia arthritidis]|uniref:Uncharacterized protein n=1 Tax=Nocardia arthritidis TaxID=228602 RepID=A0A6G9Y906_9NOCA|nr:hypothetical protein [Nocardia arthritidis]QIS09600.1 hypothetical protein F5544_08490 [Nocardia arthritidis]
MNIAQNADAAGLPRLLESPGHGIFLRYDTQNAADDSEVTRIALRAIFDFAELFCRPLLIGLSTAYWEDDFDWPMNKPKPAAPYRVLRSARPPEGLEIRPLWADEQVTVAEELDYDTVSGFVANAVGSDPAGVRMNWDYLWVRASMVRLPSTSRLNEDGSISVQDRIWTLDHPVENLDGAHWVCGPRRNTLDAPIEFQLGRQFFELSLRIAIHWSIWAPGGSGHPRIHAGVETLRAAGWTVGTAETPPRK